MNSNHIQCKYCVAFHDVHMDVPRILVVQQDVPVQFFF